MRKAWIVVRWEGKHEIGSIYPPSLGATARRAPAVQERSKAQMRLELSPDGKRFGM